MSDRPWFKMWTEARSDPKFVAVACDNQIEVVTAFGIWTMLLCIASEAPVRGTLVSASGRNYSIQELDVIVGFKGNMSTGDLSSVMESFESLDMIDKDEFGAYRIKHFEERQETREERIDRLNRERQKRYRETHKQTASVISNVTNNDHITQDSDSDSDSFNSINNTMSLNKTLNAGAEKKVMYTMMNAEGVYCRVTGLAGISMDFPGIGISCGKRDPEEGGMESTRKDLAGLAGLLILRLGIGGYMLTHGWGKLQMVIAGNFAKFGDPIGLGSGVSLVLVTVAEFLCSLLVMLGFATRFAAGIVVFAMAVAGFVAHAGHPWTRGEGAKLFLSGGSKTWASKEPALFYLVPFLALVFTGAGRFSIDGLIRSRRRG